MLKLFYLKSNDGEIADIYAFSLEEAINRAVSVLGGNPKDWHERF